MNRPLKIALVVHGRFYAFELSRELILQGHDVTVFTNYPKSIAARFGLPRARVKSFLLHGIASRAAHGFKINWLEPFFHKQFGAWAVRQIKRDCDWDLIHSFSGVAEEIFAVFKDGAKGHRRLVRGSAHISEQRKILDQEEIRTGIKIDKPSDWMIKREEREYALSDSIQVLSSFAFDSFVNRGLKENTIMIPLGTDLSRFKASGTAVSERKRRILEGAPLRVLTVGTFSYQKGVLELAEASKQLHGRMQFRFVGTLTPEALNLSRQLRRYVEFRERVPQFELPEVYAWADVFYYPSIQDGYAVVLAQAQAAGLPILATTNCSAPDLLEEGRSGWIIPIRDAAAAIQRLIWCDEHRDELSDVADYTFKNTKIRDWSQVAREFIDTLPKTP